MLVHWLLLSTSKIGNPPKRHQVIHIATGPLSFYILVTCWTAMNDSLQTFIIFLNCIKFLQICMPVLKRPIWLARFLTNVDDAVTFGSHRCFSVHSRLGPSRPLVDRLPWLTLWNQPRVEHLVSSLGLNSLFYSNMCKSAEGNQWHDSKSVESNVVFNTDGWLGFQMSLAGQ